MFGVSYIRRLESRTSCDRHTATFVVAIVVVVILSSLDVFATHMREVSAI
jgi:hypothetical protein